MLQVERGAAQATPRPSATPVGLVISLPIRSMRIQERLRRRPDIDVCLTARRVAELAAFAGRDWLRTIICEPADAKEIRGLLHPGQQVVELGLDDTEWESQDDIPVDPAGWTRSTLLGGFVTVPPTYGPAFPERRTGKPDISRSGIVAWLLKQYDSEAESAEGAGKYVVRSAGEWILSAIPHIGRSTAVLFFGTHRIPESKRDADTLLKRLRSALRGEDALVRLDDSTFAVLTAVPAPVSIPSLLTRLSWRLWPVDPTLVAASYAVWQPGRGIHEVLAAGRNALFAAVDAPMSSEVVSPSRALDRAGTMQARFAAPPASMFEAPHPALRRRGTEIEPWCADLPGFAGAYALRLAVEAQEEEEFGHVGHGLGVARVSEGLAAAMHGPADLIEQLRMAALLHDGGKLALDRALWGGRGTIMPWQRKLMETHASLGSELADQVGVSEAAVLAILHHHERWDGTGYPANLQGEHIPLPARILFVAEVVDSMLRASYRRPPLTPVQVVGVLESGAGRLWDPEVARHAVRMVRGSS